MTKKAKIKSASTPRANISAGINTVVGLGMLIGVSSNTTILSKLENLIIDMGMGYRLRLIAQKI